MATNAFDTDDIKVVIEGDDEGVQREPDGSIVIPQPGGGVVVQLNPPHDDDEEAEDPKKFYANIAEKIGDHRLAVIAEELFEAVSADDSSRSEWLSERAERMALLGLKMENPSTSDGSAVDGQSIVTNPLLLDAVLRGWANAQAELLPAEGPCKIANYDPKQGSEDDELAEAYQRDFNYYLTSIATEFVPETQHMLLWGVYFGGSGFKKVYTHPLKRRPTSEQVAPEHLIVSDATKDLASCERITHVITMRQSVMKRYIAKGIYRRIDLMPPSGDSSDNPVTEQIASMQGISPKKDRPEDQPYTLWEVQTELDLPEFAPTQWKNSGVPLPYLVTMDKDTHEILSVRRDWKPEDEDCARKRMYVKYPYVPGPGFYGTGLAAILGNSSAAMTAAWREMLDAGMFANFPAFVMDKLAGRQNTSDFRLSPGTAVGIETGGRPIGEVVANLPYKDVTPGLMSLVQHIQEVSKQVGGAPDIPVGEGMQNIPVGTMLAHIEQATKVMAAAHKGQHTAMDEELQLLADLFKENPESFWRTNRRAPRDFWTVQKLLQALDSHMLVPRSDPNVPSHIHRVMQAVALVELMAGPLGKLLDPMEVLRRALVAIRVDPSNLIKPPDPNAKDPQEMLAEAKAKEADAKAKKADNDVIIAQTKLPVEQMKAQAMIKGKELELARTLAANEDEQKRAEIDAQIAQGEFQLQGSKIDSENRKREHDAMIDEQKLGLEHAKVQLGHREVESAERQGEQQVAMQQQEHQLAREQHADQTALQADMQQHQKGVDHAKAATDLAKVSVSGHQAETQRTSAESGAATKQHQADTQRYVAKHPPKPAGGAKKPKGKK